MKSFSLATLLLLVVIVALAVSQFVLTRKLSEANSQVDEVRRKYELAHPRA